MITTAKVLIPNKYWIVEQNGSKFGTLSKEKKGYRLSCQGKKYDLDTLDEIKEKFGITISDDIIQKEKKSKVLDNDVYGFPTNGKTYNPLWNVQKNVPIFTKTSRSKSLYCAGYYIIQFRKGWVRSFCPKLITLERYAFRGPFKTELEMKTILASAPKQP